MPPALQHEIRKKRPFDLPEEEAFLNVVRTASLLSADFDRLFREHGLSEATYNVLRILRGHGAVAPESSTAPDIPGLPCSHVGEQMVTRVPDVTRLLDRLESLGMVERARTQEDRRKVLVRVTRRGLDALAALDGPVRELHKRQLGHMPREELSELTRLLEKARAGAPAR